MSSYGFVLHELSIDRSAKNIFSVFSTFLRIFTICCFVRPDVLHLVTIQPVLIGGLAARLASINNIVFAISGLGHSFHATSFFSRIRLFFIKLLYRIALSAPSRIVLFQNADDKSFLSDLCCLSELKHAYFSAQVWIYRSLFISLLHVNQYLLY